MFLVNTPSNGSANQRTAMSGGVLELGAIYFGCILELAFFGRLSLAQELPVDVVGIQLQQFVAFGAQAVSERVLLNGVPHSGPTQEVNGIIQRMSADPIPLTLLANQTIISRNHMILRSRDCILEGSEIHWTDRVFYNGSLYLSLDHGGAWVAHTLQAMALKASWVQAVGSPAREGIHLQDACVNLMEKLKLSEERPGIRIPHFLIPILGVLTLIGLIGLSLFLATRHGLRHPGGVLGSIIHYRSDMGAFHPEQEDNGYRTL
ncbi:uncharacterized protein LOC133511131 [Syngnathoides biaculeatus]|uniref:uncharacterized protein LOC133511131 n=1 Tax=Syngnathoides biaculeatus TaxID=300417 RepID=UPI002ADD8AA1|nr:uncharacterized protein LOC133511131 [Syngnathoides biaculeatus]